MKPVDLNIETARLQKEISTRLAMPLDNLVFDFSHEGEQTRLDLITINPRHDQSFLFHSISGESKVHALERMLEYVSQKLRQERSYTVQWVKKGETELQTSYFRASDMADVLKKFAYGRNIEDYVIFSITLNPMA